jgi:glycerophosphoryl diester phosphodiesterase
VKTNSATPLDTFLDRIARQARAYKGPIALMSFDRDVVSALAKLAPTVPRGPVIGSHQLPARWWATPAAAGRTTIARLLNRAPAGSAFLAVDVRMLRPARAWMTRHALDLPLFSWTIRTRRERATAARFADAPIFEAYEP